MRKELSHIQSSRVARQLATAGVLWLIVVIGGACATAVPSPAPRTFPNELVVTATAYNSTVAQTDSDPFMTAHGVRLRPGMQVIAISRDLEAMGLSPGTRVRIEGLPGEWSVADRMARRWKRKIDVYMGLDVEGARQFGRRRVKMSWAAAND
jgi:3D (Asp-Asp-Asp) domain-containing protein